MIHAYADSLRNVFPHPTEDYDWEGILHRLYHANLGFIGWNDFTR